MSRKTLFALPVLLVVVVFSSPVDLKAQDQDPCNGELSHQFDFWVGEWEVYSGDDVAGKSLIEPIMDGCALQENWRGSQGSVGTSFNYYNPTAKKWQQKWVWQNGTILELEGEYQDGKMVLEGESLSQKGETIHNRISWHDNDDGTVRQHWEYSKDGGATFETAFDGLYKKK